MGCCLLVASVVSRRPWDAGEKHKEKDRWKEGVESGREVVVVGAVGGLRGSSVFTCRNQSWAVAAGCSLEPLCSRSRRPAGGARVRARWAPLWAWAVACLQHRRHKRVKTSRLLFWKVLMSVLGGLLGAVFTVYDGLGLGGLFLLFPQGLGGFKLVHLQRAHRQQQSQRQTLVTFW